MTSVTREEFLRLAGVEGEYRPYIPSSIGRNNSIVKNNKRTFATNMRDLNFLSSEELRKQRPQAFKRLPVYFKNENGGDVMMNGFRGIVGASDNNTYAVVSDKYKVVQHRAMIDSMTDAADSAGVRVFGRTFDMGGHFNGYAWFSNKGSHIFLDDEKYDPMILGFRFYNSCLGDHVLGGEIVGVRSVCWNVGVYGDILGEVNIRHFKCVEDVSEKISKVLKTYIYRKDRLNDIIHGMKAETLDADEQETILWGLKFDARTIERIISNRTTLNPEIGDPKKVSLFDLYNATTAYITYRSGSDTQIVTNKELSSKIGKIFTENSSELIDRGIEQRESYYASLEPESPPLVAY